ncbi:MAG TPA: phytanoyl-CoA dioxygenase family protein [Baekduia sp.]|uniref:phytanoyl-CoA dioxygenase family protein n=1 Tax=Baekduia sp. TaxID=2600305 RepID=UPI002CE09082|nr:phytanoyl-CoA dioxygenase family protein [Baekduia sp.]HMJ35389.1 phytanoyl-CoA dioxygenase family protein [Baekduia sp.]
MDVQQQWEQDGYLVLRGAVPAEAVGAYAGDVRRLRDGLLVRRPGDDQASLAAHAEPGEAGAIDPYSISEAARAVLLGEAAVATLTELLDGAAPLLFDATEALAGAPEPGPYRDATYVAVSPPEALVAAAVALGDGPVEITVFAGSQRIATTPFSGRYRHVNLERDGEAALARHRAEVAAALATGEAAPTALTLSPGDVLLWQADLIHEPIAGDALVAHLCPVGAQPAWFAYRPERAGRAAVGAAWIATQHYDLVDAVEPEPVEPAAPQDDEETEHELRTVEKAMRAHDDRPPDAPAAPPPAPPPGRRGGGIVETVRGFMGRRGNR